MKAAQIEAWALAIVDRVLQGQPNEDARVELKADWIDAKKAARRLAGHANWARGDSILWLIGVDQKRGVVGVKHKDLESWLPQVKAEFNEGIYPRPVDLNIPYDDKTIVALYFETDRAPFVVRNPAHGTAGNTVELEVPWREGTAIRSARRADLIRLLVPKLSIPEVEILKGHLSIRGKKQNDEQFSCHLRAELYLVSSDATSLTLPFHRCSVTLSSRELDEEILLSHCKLEPPQRSEVTGYRQVSGYAQVPEIVFAPDSKTIYATGHQLVVGGPGLVELTAWGEMGAGFVHRIEQENLSFQLQALPVHSEDPVICSGELEPSERDEDRDSFQWRFTT